MVLYYHTRLVHWYSFSITFSVELYIFRIFVILYRYLTYAGAFCKYELMSTFYPSPINVDNDFCSRFVNHKFCIHHDNAKQFTFIYNQGKHLLSKK